MIKTKLFTATLAFLCSFACFSSSHHPQMFLKTIEGKKEEGLQIVKHFCANCHAEKPVIPLGAPRIGITEDWSLRLKPGFSLLIKHTEEGMNAMPARGGCFECSNKQLILAILAMLPEKEQKRLQVTLKDLN